MNNKIKILIINPNSGAAMTGDILKSARIFAEGNYDVDCKFTPGAPEFIETYEDELKAAPGMLDIVRKYQNDFDGFVVACHCDPNLDLLKEVSDKPIVGIGEASMKMATMLGHRFAVVSATGHSIPNKEALARKYHLQDMMVSVRAPFDESSNYTEEQKYLQASRLAIDQDGAEVIVLGCAGLTGMDKTLEIKLGVPVLDGVICALIIVTGLVNYGVSISKLRRYNPIPKTSTIRT